MKSVIKAAVLTLLLVGCKKSNEAPSITATGANAQALEPVFIRMQAVDNDGYTATSTVATIKIK